MKSNVYIIGAKGIGNYGGYETFLKELINTDKDNKNIIYHIACKYNGQGAMDESKLDGAQTIDDYHFTYYNADCFKIKVPEKFGSAQAIYYDIAALRECIRQIKSGNIKSPIIYILACRIGPFINKYVKIIHRLGGRVFVNPDGHEWLRAKWPKVVRKYWKLSEAKMVKNADLLVCDSINIEKYIQSNYKKYVPNTTFIAYGAENKKTSLGKKDGIVRDWYSKHDVKEQEYFLIVGRFVPENNYLTMIREFMNSEVRKDLVIITNVTHNQFFESLKEKTHFDRDKRIKFVGTVYNKELLKYIRENAFGYLHGHSVGGTNPSLLEALSSTNLNLLYKVGFNQEVAGKAALYWDKETGSLSNLLNKAEKMDQAKINTLGQMSRQRIENNYSWQLITDKYNKIFRADHV